MSIPLSLARSYLPAPSAVTYNLSAVAGTLKALPKQLQQGSVSSADFGPGSEWELQLPVNWSAVPLEASYRWALDLQPAWLSQVTGNASNSTIAVHLFGVEEGQCPPGTIRCGARCERMRLWGRCLQHGNQACRQCLCKVGMACGCTHRIPRWRALSQVSRACAS